MVMFKPPHFFHGYGNILCEGGNLALLVYEEGILSPPPSDLDCVLQDVGNVKGHGPAQLYGMGSNFRSIAAQLLETQLPSCHPKSLCYVVAYD